MLVNILGNTINTEGIYRIGPIYPEDKFAIAYKFKIMFFNDKDMIIERSVGEDVTFEDLGEEVTDSYKKNWPSITTVISSLIEFVFKINTHHVIDIIGMVIVIAILKTRI
jgi:hypothetical protein